MASPEIQNTKGANTAPGDGISLIDSRGVPREISPETAAAIVTRVRNLPDQLYKQTDEKTGLLTRAPLLSEHGIAEMNATLGYGPKYFALIDLNHVNIADKFGLGKNVDEYFATIRSLAERKLSPNPYSLLRIGGDEIVLIVSDTHRSDGFKKIKSFLAGMEDLRREKISSGSAQTTIASLAESVRDIVHTSDPVAYLGAVRTLMRLLRTEHKSECAREGRTLSQSSFSEFLKHRLAEEGMFYPRTRSTGEMQLQLAIRLLGNDPEQRSRVMTPTASVIATSGTLSWTSLHILFSTADLELYRRKIAGKDGIDGLQWRLPETTLRVKESAREEMQSFRECEARYIEARSVLTSGGIDDTGVSSCHRALRLACEDPSAAGVIRTHLARHFTARELFLLEKPQLIYRIDLDVPGWGILNHVVGYTKADGLFRRITQIGQQTLPHGALIRSQGGGLTLVDGNEVSEEHRRTIHSRVRSLVSDVVKDPRFAEEIQIEEEEKRALRDLYDTFKLNTSPPLAPLGSVNCILRTQRINPEMTIDEISRGDGVL